MVARFTKDKYGWRCTDVFEEITNGAPVIYLPILRVLLVNVSRAPRLGFSKRPHHYI